MEVRSMNGNSQGSFPAGQSLEDYVKDVMVHVRGCQKLSGELAGWHHYRDYSGVERTMEQVNSFLVSLVSSIFKHQDIKISLSRHKLLDQFDMMREGNDALLERINSDVDEASGLKKNAEAELLEPSILKKVEGPASTALGRNIVLMASRSVQKPQLFFEQKVDNSHKTPFMPLIDEKPNNIKPLAIMLCLDESGNEFYSHPYEYELHHWNPPQSQLAPVDPTIPNPISDTAIVIVETAEDLNKVVAELKQCQEFAFDIEHHSYRSYQGLTCLIQISTREMDYIIDPLRLRGKLTILNEVFTDPKITKVAHGADHDVFWLQRDCGVYIVNLFDTHQAAVVLEYPHRSLAALLSRFCQIEANKVYQRADWRIRPLPEDFIDYARQDSHYLLYIYDLMRNELISKGNKLNNLISAVYNRSTEICLKRYEKPIVGPDSHMDIYRRSRKYFNSRQMFGLQAVYLWRDRIGRAQDECPEYVLPKHMLLQIAEVLPKDMQGILACCNPIPPLVKTELLTIHTLIREAREQPLIDIKPSIHEEQHHPHRSNVSGDDLGVHLISKHDLSQCEENPSDLPVLIKPGENLLGDLFVQHKINVSFKKMSQMFHCLKNDLEYKIRGDFEISEQFSSPYERYTNYLEMKPFLEGEKKKGGDQDRINRIMEHFITLTTNTREELEDDMSAEPSSLISAEGSKSHQTERDQQSHKQLLDIEDEREKGNSANQETAQETVNVVERQITHQAIDSFLESARQKSSKSPSKTDHVGRLLNHFRTLVGADSVDSSESHVEEDAASVSNDIPEKDTKSVAKKAKRGKKKMVLGDEVKMKKSKTKSAKRQSTETEDDSPPKKRKVDVNISNAEEQEHEEGEISDSDSGKDGEASTFDYNAADYSIFQKGKRKSYYKKPIREKFKGKKEKKFGGRSNPKSYL